MVDSDGDPLDGMTVWRLIRSLRPESVTITLAVRSGDTDTTQPDPPSLNLTAARRRYTDDRTGVIDNAYQPGELTAGLCSPWTHDFRDCSCTYWASNHPDIVLPAVATNRRLQPSGLPTDPAYQTQINWLRDPAFPDMQAPALPSQGANRPLEANYYQINKAWQDLAVVLEGRETDGIYVPRGHRRDHAEPFADSAELMARIAELAGLEHLVAVMYLYALFSVIDNDQAEAVQDGGTWPTITEDIAFTRAVITEVAIGEMQHMRSANRLLWELAKHTGTQHTARVQPPALRLPTAVVPMTAGATAAELLAPLTLTTVGKFIEIERSSAYIDGQYARVTATLKQPGYPPSLFELASTIANEGEEHFLDFCDIRRALTQYGSENPVYLRPMTAGDPATNPDVQAALDTYRAMLADLETGYTAPKASDQAMALGQARAKMFELSEQAEATRRQRHRNSVPVAVAAMTLGQPDPCVAIAGGGIAASALAMVLRARGFGVVILASRARRAVSVVECIPAATADLLGEIGLGPALYAASPIPVAGMVNRFATSPELVAGQWMHLDRAALAANALMQARRRGATVLRETTAPSAVTAGTNGVEIRTSAGSLRLRAAVDATGRAAVWSRPVTRTRAASAAVHRDHRSDAARPA